MEKSEGFEEIVEVKPESRRVPIATWLGTIEIGYSDVYDWSIRLHDKYVSVTMPTVSFLGRTRGEGVRAQIVYETHRYYGPLHRALMDLHLSNDGAESTDREAINLFSQHYRTE